MRINSNIVSLQAQNQMSRTTRAISQSLERLSSGLRINAARDDSAGLGIATGLEAQRRGIYQSIRNVNDSLGYLATADGAIDTQTEIVQRMRELAIQASSGVISTNDRGNLEQEFQSLYSELDRISNSTQFNGVKLLDGSLGTLTLQAGPQSGNSLSINLSTTTVASIMKRTVGTGVFTETQSYARGSSGYTNDVKIVDINGDGRVDIVAPGHDTIDVYLGQVGGTFSSRITSAVTSAFTQRNNSGLFDFNGDGKLDYMGGVGGVVQIYFGDGAGHFTAGSTVANSIGAGTVFGDFNGDGKIDYMYQDWFGAQMQIMLGDGQGGFSTGGNFAIGVSIDEVFSGLSSVVSQGVADINGDGILDFARYDPSVGKVVTFLGDGVGGFSMKDKLQISGASTNFRALGDVNGDGRADLIAQDATGAAVALAQSDGSYTSFTRISGASLNFNPKVVDINGDGYGDILDQNMVYLSNGDGTFQSVQSSSVSTSVSDSSAADINGDGVPDLIYTNDSKIFVCKPTTSTRFFGTDMSIATQARAQTMLNILDNALKGLNTARSAIGSSQNRLESVVQSLSLTGDSISTAKSSLLDVDYASESADLVRQQILQQAQVSVLGQANIQLQIALQLLRF